MSISCRVQQSARASLPASVHAEPRATSRGARRLLESYRPSRGFDLVHGLDVDLPLRTGCPRVSTVHDLSVFDVPWNYSPTRWRGEQLAVRLGVRSAAVCVAPSRFTADRLRQLFGVESVVIPLAPRPEFGPTSEAEQERLRHLHRLPDRFVLHVGTIERRKNIEQLAAACEKLRIPLVLAGSGQLDASGDIRHLGYVDEGDLPGLYGAATAVAYISRYEGFGLPPVEALACDAVVVASRVGGLPDVLPHADLVEPGNADHLVELLETAISDEAARRVIRELGARAVARLSWERTADETIEVYRSLGVGQR